ncbi:MAG: M48 family metalloprotease [Candidatus Omnitrophica bacterium]|nr:M48 family metalloprotease [Candidatus Omnitrophota bacterium]
MKCPICKEIDLVPVMTKNGVLVDLCPKCEGVWLDKGEIFYFTKAPAYLRWSIEEALKGAKPSSKVNPHTQDPLIELSLFGGKLVIDYCPKSGGIWLDKRELQRLPLAKKAGLKIDIDRNTRPGTQTEKRAPLVVLPNLGLVSGITLFLLYSLLALVLITLVNFGVLDSFLAILVGVAFAVLQFLFSPFLMDISLRWFYKVKWTAFEDLPSHLKSFLQDICSKHKIKIPRIGIIPDGSPNAFTYGHTPNNARIVITSGIKHLLETQELEAVVAHEIGHAVHWDMLIMTIAYLVPLILYYIFRTLIRMKTKGKDKSAPYRYAIAIASYIIYTISEYIVLWFSRVREYFADRFAGQATQSPNTLASALVKIGYGLAGKEKGKDNEKDQRAPQLESVKAMGIFDPTSARALAVTSYHPQSLGGEIDKENLKWAMKWDVWNPWAKYYELHSTHPLIAKRLLALSRQSEAIGKQPYITFDERRPESYWDEFFVDLFIRFLPLLAIIISIIWLIVSKDLALLKFGLVLLGVSYLINVTFSYKSSFFPEMNISSLLKKVKVSSVRPVPCTIKGKIIGRGIPGLIWSEDFVLQDKTGIIFLDYRQPLGIWNFLFGLLRAKRYIGQDITITGWYRRSPVPYVEIKSLETDSGTSNCYVFNVKIAWAVILIILGIGSVLFF